MGRKVDEGKKELAFILYMSGELQKDIAERVGTSAKTVGEWSEKGLWKEKRSAKNITRTELVNKSLNAIAAILDDAVDNGADSKKIDQLSKLAKMIEGLDKKNNPVAVMEALTLFIKFLQQLIRDDKEVTLEFIKKATLYMDKYINTLITQH
jgi:uncharacterized protein YjcR